MRLGSVNYETKGKIAILRWTNRAPRAQRRHPWRVFDGLKEKWDEDRQRPRRHHRQRRQSILRWRRY